MACQCLFVNINYRIALCAASLLCFFILGVACVWVWFAYVSWRQRCRCAGCSLYIGPFVRYSAFILVCSLYPAGSYRCLGLIIWLFWYILEPFLLAGKTFFKKYCKKKQIYALLFQILLSLCIVNLNN